MAVHYTVLIWIYLKLNLTISIFTCRLQTEDSSLHQLEGEFQSVISALRSKLDSRAAPPILHLDTVYLQDESPNSPPLPTSLTGPPSSSSSSSQKSQQPWSLLTALMNEIQKLRTQDETVTQDEIVTEDESQSESATSEDFTFVENGDRTELKSSALPLPAQTTTVAQPVTEGAHTETTADPRQTVHAVKTLSLHRKYRSLLRKRQTPGASGKSMSHTQFSLNLH